MKRAILPIVCLFIFIAIFQWKEDNTSAPKEVASVADSVFRVKKRLVEDYDLNNRDPRFLKILRRAPNGRSDKEFTVDRDNLKTLHDFITKSGDQMIGLTLKNFNTEEKVSTDVWYHRFFRGSKLELRRNFLYNEEVHSKAILTLQNCMPGWFPFPELSIDRKMTKELIKLNYTMFSCEAESNLAMTLIEKYGSFAVRVVSNCKWRYWNFNISQVDVEKYDLRHRDDLKYAPNIDVYYLAIKEFGKNTKLLKEWLVEPLRLDWIDHIGTSFDSLKNTRGYLVFKETSIAGALLLKNLKSFRCHTDNLQQSAPFIIHSMNNSCDETAEKFQLLNKFGVVALQVLGNCPTRKVLILDGKQPFDYVSTRDDLKFNTNDTLLYADIRYFTNTEHLRKLENWFHQMGYYNVREVGMAKEALGKPEVYVRHSISTFNPFPYLERVVRKNSSTQYNIPILYFRNNSGADCESRRVSRTFRRTIGKFSVATSEDCECGPWTSDSYFWDRCRVHRGSINVQGSARLPQYKKIEKIVNGQLWIHNTENLRDLSELSGLKEVVPEYSKTDIRKMAAVRIDGYNFKLEWISLPELNSCDRCLYLISADVRRKNMPRFSKSPWMQKHADQSSVITDERKINCSLFELISGDFCDTIQGDLVIDGHLLSEAMIEAIFSEVRRVIGSVIARNLNVEHFIFLQNIKFIEGNFEIINNPRLKTLPPSLMVLTGNLTLINTPHLCLQIQKVPIVAEALRQKKPLQCSFPDDDKFLLDSFQQQLESAEMVSHITILLSCAFLVCYLMRDVFLRQLKCLVITRWRKMRELDIRLKSDPSACLDEESSDEEPDVLTWKRKTMVKNRLDGRDVIKEALKREHNNYRKNNVTVTKKQRLVAFLKIGFQNEFEGEFSGLNWLRKNQYKKNARMQNIENDDYTIDIPSEQEKTDRRINHILSDIERAENNDTGYNDAMMNAVRKVIKKQVLKDEKIIPALNALENRKLIPSAGQLDSSSQIDYAIAKDANDFEELIVNLRNETREHDEKEWKDWAQARKKLRDEAIEKYGEHFNEIEMSQEEHSARLGAGIEAGKQETRGMFEKVIVETMHWKPTSELNNHTSFMC